MYRALAVLGWPAVFSPSAQAWLEIIDLGKTYRFDSVVTPSWLRNHIERDNDVIGGNTSIRNETADSLDWKGDPNSNGYGYYQRNRDLGQVINIPAGEDVKIDAIVLRTGRGNNAIMAGTPGAKMYVQFFEVVEVPGETLRINENGTTKGQRATHGFDMKYNRADDFVEGVEYVPIARITGGVFPPDSPPTTRYAYRHRSGEPFGVQPGHLRYFRFDLTEDDEIALQGGKRYVFMIGFDEPGRDRGLGIAITTKVHTLEVAEFDRDSNGEIRWAVRREGDGTLPPTMLDTTQSPTDPNLRNKLINESMFQPNHWNTLRPTSDGYPDVDTYMTRQFYIETKPAAIEQTDIFISGQGGYHTYRIPAMVVTNQQTVLAFCEGRKTSRKDHGDVDLVLRRSTDGGHSWSAMQLVYEEGGTTPITIGNPCPVVDRATGTVWLPFCRDNKEVFITSSKDDGMSWSRPVNISSTVTLPAWKWVATGPGHGIQLTSGRLLIPCDHSFYLHGDKRRGPAAHSHVFYSDNHGKTWQLGGITNKSMHECQVVERSDGSLLLSMRNYVGCEQRAFATSSDDGLNWTEPRLNPNVYCPVCQAGLLRLSIDENRTKDVIVYSGPAGPGRRRLTIRRSKDGGMSWRVARVLHDGPAGYSDLAILSDGYIGCLYERGEDHFCERITFARLSRTRRQDDDRM